MFQLDFTGDSLLYLDLLKGQSGLSLFLFRFRGKFFCAEGANDFTWGYCSSPGHLAAAMEILIRIKCVNEYSSKQMAYAKLIPTADNRVIDYMFQVSLLEESKFTLMICISVVMSYKKAH